MGGDLRKSTGQYIHRSFPLLCWYWWRNDKAVWAMKTVWDFPYLVVLVWEQWPQWNRDLSVDVLCNTAFTVESITGFWTFCNSIIWPNNDNGHWRNSKSNLSVSPARFILPLGPGLALSSEGNNLKWFRGGC